MTKTLVLIRHAKAEIEADLGDRQRPLALRGRRQAAALGERLAEEAGPFDVAIVSGALRTQETYRILAGNSPVFPTPRVADDLYEASPRSVLAKLRALRDIDRRVIVVGHEPVMSTLAYLVHDSHDEFTSQLQMGIPTATAVVLDVPVPWADLDRNRAHARAVLRPSI